MIRNFDDNWLGRFSDPLVPHSVRRRRMLRRAMFGALAVGAIGALCIGAFYVTKAFVHAAATAPCVPLVQSNEP